MRLIVIYTKTPESTVLPGVKKQNKIASFATPCQTYKEEAMG